MHKIRTSFKTLASTKASIWRLKLPQRNDKLLWKVMSSSNNKKHSSKQILPMTYTLEKESLMLLRLKVCGGRSFSDKVKKRVVYFGLFESSLHSGGKKTKEILFVRSKFRFLYEHIWSDVTKCRFIVKNSSLKCCLCFRLFFGRH